MNEVVTTVSPALLSAAARAHIDQWVKKYPADQKQSAVIAALTFVQEENGGWLTTPLCDAVAAYLNMPKIAVYEVASFYSMYELKPVGKYKICICTNISCMLSGSEEVIKHLEKKLNITLGETTPDQRFTLKAVECLAACGGAPAMQIGPQYYENLTAQKVDEIIDPLE
jgi:NADH-quinone oxidoreductase subunit E